MFGRHPLPPPPAILSSCSIDCLSIVRQGYWNLQISRLLKEIMGRCTLRKGCQNSVRAASTAKGAAPDAIKRPSGEKGGWGGIHFWLMQDREENKLSI